MSYRLAQLTRQIGRQATEFTTRRIGISPILKRAAPPDFSNKYYWLKNMNENKYAFGSTEEFKLIRKRETMEDIFSNCNV